MSTPPSDDGREVAITQTISIDMWHDEGVRQSWMVEAERQLAELAWAEGYVITTTARQLMTAFQKFEGDGEDAVMVPCVQEEAEVVVVRLSAMAVTGMQPIALPGHIHTAELLCTQVCPGWRML
jgi:hypothetical protein